MGYNPSNSRPDCLVVPYLVLFGSVDFGSYQYWFLVGAKEAKSLKEYGPAASWARPGLITLRRHSQPKKQTIRLGHTPNSSPAYRMICLLKSWNPMCLRCFLSTLFIALLSPKLTSQKTLKASSSLLAMETAISRSWWAIWNVIGLLVGFGNGMFSASVFTLMKTYVELWILTLTKT